MKYSIFVSFFLPILTFVGCSQSSVEVTKEYFPDDSIKSMRKFDKSSKTEEIQRYDEDGKPWQIRKLKDGKIVSDRYFYQNGQLSSTYPYKNGKKNGIAKGYYPDGKLLFSIGFKDNREDGDTLYYYPNGNIAYKVEYESRDGFENGTKHGTSQTLTLEGKVIASGEYKDGYPWNGTFTSGRKDRIEQNRREKYLLKFKDGKLVDASILEKPLIKPWMTSDAELEKFRKSLREKASSEKTNPIPITVTEDINASKGREFKILEASVEKDMLVLHVNFEGVQRTHEFSAYWNGQFLRSNPPKVVLRIVDDTQEDKNHGLVGENIYISLEKFKSSRPVTLFISNPFGSEKSVMYE